MMRRRLAVRLLPCTFSVQFACFAMPGRGNKQQYAAYYTILWLQTDAYIHENKCCTDRVQIM